MLTPCKVAKKEKSELNQKKAGSKCDENWGFKMIVLGTVQWGLLEVLREEFAFEGASSMSLTFCFWFHLVPNEWEGAYVRSTWKMNLLWSLRSIALSGSGEGWNEILLAILPLPLYPHLLHVTLSFSPLETEWTFLIHTVGLHRRSASANGC